MSKSTAGNRNPAAAATTLKDKDEYSVKVVIIGDGKVGKTSMMMRFSDNIFSRNYIQTIGVDFKIKHMEIAGKRVRVQIWDTAGQEIFLSITKRFYRGAHGIIMAYDVTSAESFHHVRDWMERIKEQADPNVSVVLVGNKIDKTNERKVLPEIAQRVAREFHVPFIETSALTGENIDTLFTQLLTPIVIAMDSRETTKRRASVIQPSEKDTPTNSCPC